jgi:hypothetical protein
LYLLCLLTSPRHPYGHTYPFRSFLTFHLLHKAFLLLGFRL